MIDLSSPYDPPHAAVTGARDGARLPRPDKRRALLALGLGLSPIGAVGLAILLAMLGLPADLAEGFDVLSFAGR